MDLNEALFLVSVTSIVAAVTFFVAPAYVGLAFISVPIGYFANKIFD